MGFLFKSSSYLLWIYFAGILGPSVGNREENFKESMAMDMYRIAWAMYHIARSVYHVAWAMYWYHCLGYVPASSV